MMLVCKPKETIVKSVLAQVPPTVDASMPSLSILLLHSVIADYLIGQLIVGFNLAWQYLGAETAAYEWLCDYLGPRTAATSFCQAKEDGTKLDLLHDERDEGASAILEEDNDYAQFKTRLLADEGFKYLVNTLGDKKNKKRKNGPDGGVKIPFDYLSPTMRDETIESMVDTLRDLYDEPGEPCACTKEAYVRKFHDAMQKDKLAEGDHPFLFHEKQQQEKRAPRLYLSEYLAEWMQAFCEVCGADKSNRGGHFMKGHMSLHDL